MLQQCMPVSTPVATLIWTLHIRHDCRHWVGVVYVIGMFVSPILMQQLVINRMLARGAHIKHIGKSTWKELAHA